MRGFSHLRSPEVFFNNDEHLVKYIRQVLQLREEKEEQEQKEKKEEKEKKEQQQGAARSSKEQQ